MHVHTFTHDNHTHPMHTKHTHTLMHTCLCTHKHTPTLTHTNIQHTNTHTDSPFSRVHEHLSWFSHSTSCDLQHVSPPITSSHGHLQLEAVLLREEDMVAAPVVGQREQLQRFLRYGDVPSCTAVQLDTVTTKTVTFTQGKTSTTLMCINISLSMRMLKTN